MVVVKECKESGKKEVLKVLENDAEVYRAIECIEEKHTLDSNVYVSLNRDDNDAKEPLIRACK